MQQVNSAKASAPSELKINTQLEKLDKILRIIDSTIGKDIRQEGVDEEASPTKEELNSAETSAPSTQKSKVKKRLPIIDPFTGKDILQEDINEETSPSKEELHNQNKSGGSRSRQNKLPPRIPKYRDVVPRNVCVDLSKAPHIRAYYTPATSITNTILGSGSPVIPTNVQMLPSTSKFSSFDCSNQHDSGIDVCDQPASAAASQRSSPSNDCNIIRVTISERSTASNELSDFSSFDVCLQCKNKVSKHELASHKQSCNKTSKMQCPYCEKEVSVRTEEHNLEDLCEVYQQFSVNKLLQGLKEIFLNSKHSDFILNVKGKDFRVHKIILASHSPVFAAMFEHDTKDKANGITNIDDCDPVIFSNFLNFLYTGKIENLNSDNVLDLYEVADKYLVTELSDLCIKYMMKNISVENFCDILTLSLCHHVRDLTEVATQFFLQNSKEIAITCKWGAFLAENPVAGNELFLKALNFKK